MEGILHLSCTLDHAFPMTANSEANPGTLVIVEDAMRIVDACFPILGSENIVIVFFSIIQEQQQSTPSLRYEEEDETPKEWDLPELNVPIIIKAGTDVGNKLGLDIEELIASIAKYLGTKFNLMLAQVNTLMHACLFC